MANRFVNASAPQTRNALVIPAELSHPHQLPQAQSWTMEASIRGHIEGAQDREAARKLWRERHVPDYARGEVVPLVPLISRRSGLVLVDVGANKGFWTKAFLCVMAGRVEHAYMLDPSPENYDELTRKESSLLFELPDFRFISAHKVAAGAASGEATLYTDEDGSPMASLYPHELTGDSGVLVASDAAGSFWPIRLTNRIPVHVTTIDDFVREQSIAHIDLLKIDTEGHEFDVLKGATNSFRRGIVDCVFFEFGTHQIESRTFFLDFFVFFAEHGFDMYHVDQAHLEAIPIYTYRFENFSGTFTFAARRRSAPLPVPPEGFNENGYLSANPDVRNAVDAGQFASGLHHWLTHGETEQRQWVR